MVEILSEDQQDRYRKYLAAIEPSGWRTEDTPLFDSSGVSEWAKRNRLAEDGGEAREWLAANILRMLRMVDAVSALDHPLAEATHHPVYDEETGCQWIRNCISTPVTLLRVEWGVDEVATQLDELHDKLIELFRSKLRVERVRKESYEIFAGGYELIPVVGLFPFFLLDERLDSWGILQYGIQEKIAFVMNDFVAKDLFKVVDRSRLIHEVSLDVIKHGIHDASGTSGEWKFLYYGVGHAAFKILLSSLDVMSYFNFRVKLDEISSVASLRQVDERSHLEQARFLLAGSNNPQFALVSDLGHPTFARMRSLAADPRFKGIKGRGLRKPLVWLELNHGLQIPVGVGFSLAMMAYFLRYPELLRGSAQIISSQFEEIRRKNLKSLANFKALGVDISPQKCTVADQLGAPGDRVRRISHDNTEVLQPGSEQQLSELHAMLAALRKALVTGGPELLKSNVADLEFCEKVLANPSRLPDVAQVILMAVEALKSEQTPVAKLRRLSAYLRSRERDYEQRSEKNNTILRALGK